MNGDPRNAAQGFTLIELVSVIIILGILSVSAVGLFADKEGFRAAAVKNQLISSLRLTQQLALSRQNLSTATPVSLAISQSGDNWQFNLWDSDPSGAGNTPYATAEAERGNVTLRFSTTDYASACSSLAQSASYSVNFDGDGNLMGSSPLRICVVGQSTFQICISGLGFPYEGGTCL